jgi:hypothetical protein
MTNNSKQTESHVKGVILVELQVNLEQPGKTKSCRALRLSDHQYYKSLDYI